MPHLARVALIFGLGTLTSCSEPDDPMEELDERYTDIMVDVGVADRDTARNVRNKEARQRKAAADSARVAFFRDPEVKAAIDAARTAEAGSLEQLKGDAYYRHLLVEAPWTEEEKDEENRILSRLEEARGMSAQWTSEDGSVTVELDQRWEEVSKAADGLAQSDRDSLAAQYVDHRMNVVGEDLQALVRLRNEVARRAGFQNYWELALAGHGLTPADVEAIIEELSAVVAPINTAVAERVKATAEAEVIPLTFANTPLLRRKAGLELGRDEADAYFDTDLAESRVTMAFQDMGIPTEGWQVYTGPQRYVRPGVYGFPVRPPEYVAIVMSQDSRWSVWQYEALAHEGGHAFWWQSIDEEAVQSPVLWQPPAPWFEGFAHFFERLTFEPGFTARYVPELPAEQRDALAHWRAVHAGESITDSIVETLVERRLYEDPTNLQAICRFAAETRARVTGAPTSLATESGLHHDDALLSSILWNYPAYAQNFLFAYLAEAWLYDGVRKAVGDPVGNPEVGPLLRDRIVRADPTLTMPERLAALAPGDRTAALEAYLVTPVDTAAGSAEATAPGD